MPILPLLVVAFPLALPVRGPLPPASAAEPRQAQSVDELLAVGRKYLLEGKFGDAGRVFQEAEQKDGGSLRTHVFVLRAALGQGSTPIEDVLAEADALKQAGKTGSELDYLYGTGFCALGAREMASGQTTAMTGTLFEDAIRHLKLVTGKGETRFDDAWATMADAAWYAQDLETGRAASAKSVELSPADPWRRLLQGRLALAEYARLQADESKADDAEDRWTTAVDAFEKALSLCGPQPDARLLPAAQQAATQLGNTFLWKQMQEEAVASFSKSIAFGPGTADYGAVSAAFSGQELVDLLARAEKTWSARHPATDAGDSALQWWLGYAHYGVKQLPEAARAFDAALAKDVKLTNSLYYLFRIRYEQRDFEQCLEALHCYDRVSGGQGGCTFPSLADAQGSEPDGLTNALAYDVPGNTARLEGLIGWALDPARDVPSNVEAAFAAGLITKIVPRTAEHSRHWNNLGLFLRDEGDTLRGTQGALEAAPRPYDEAKVNKLWQDSLAAYEAALELEPKNPNYLNDTAVMLHYYFVRDLERAKSLYKQGFDEATALLKSKDLTKDARTAVETALRDTRNNLVLVQKLIEKRAAEAAAKKEPAPPPKQ